MAELMRLRTQAASITSLAAKLESNEKESERPAKPSKFALVVGDSLRVPSTLLLSVLLAQRIKLKKVFEALVLLSQYILELAEETKELRAKAANIEKTINPAKDALVSGSGKKLRIPADRDSTALKVKLIKVHNAQKLRVEALVKCDNWAADAGTRLLLSVSQTCKIREVAEITTVKRAVVKLQAAQLARSTKNA